MKSVWRYFIVWAAVAAVLAGAAAGAAAAPGLSSGQKDQLKALASETRDKTERVRKDLWGARRELADIFGGYHLDAHKAKAIQDRVSKAQLELLKAHLDNQLQIRQVLNAEQFRKFNEMLSRKMHGKPMGGFHGSDGHGPDWFPDDTLLRTLDLSRYQLKKLGSIMGPERKKTIDKLENYTRQMIGMYQQYDLNAGAARKLIDNIHSTQQDLAALNLKSQQELRSVLSQAQFEKYRDAMAEKMRERMRDRRRPHERPRR